MRHPDARYCEPETAEDELALALARVRQRSDGLRVIAAPLGGTAAAAATLALIAYLGGGAAQLLLPVLVVLIVIPGAALVITGASSLMWRSRLRRLAQRKPHDRPRVRVRHHRLLRARGRVHPRLRPPLGRTS
jgi:hypothetical protein